MKVRQDPETEAALRVWFDDPSITISYERQGIPAITLILRREVATLALIKFDELLSVYTEAGFGDPERIETLREVATMVREVLGGSAGQVLPLSKESASFLEPWFGTS